MPGTMARPSERNSLRTRVGVMGCVFVALVVFAVGLAALMVREWDRAVRDRGQLRIAAAEVAELRLAYSDQALPIGQGQTISQPYVVAFMTEAVGPRPGHKVLEIGTGSGYQAAILAELVREVYTIELLPDLANQARDRLRRLGYKNVHVKAGDGYKGWPDAAPFDAIVVTCGAEKVPEPLFEQLKEGGTMIIPVGPSGPLWVLTTWSVSCCVRS